MKRHKYSNDNQTAISLVGKTQQGIGYNATGAYSPDMPNNKNVTIQKNSVLAIDLNKKNPHPPSVYKLAKGLLASGKLRQKPGGGFIAVTEIPGLSPSAAAVMVIGRTTNGWDDWMVGRHTLRQCTQQQPRSKISQSPAFADLESFCLFDLIQILSNHKNANLSNFYVLYKVVRDVFNQRGRLHQCNGVNPNWPKSSGVYCIWRRTSGNSDDRDLLYVGIAGKIKRHANLVGIANPQKQFPQRKSRWTPYLFDGSSIPGYFWWGPKHGMPKPPNGNFNEHYKNRAPLNEIEIDCFICTEKCISPRAIESLILQAFYECRADLPPANNEL